jgi:WD40 repeat protein
MNPTNILLISSHNTTTNKRQHLIHPTTNNNNTTTIINPDTDNNSSSSSSTTSSSSPRSSSDNNNHDQSLFHNLTHFTNPNSSITPTLTQQLAHLRNKNILIDIALVSKDGTVVHAHKVVIAAASPVLRDLLISSHHTLSLLTTRLDVDHLIQNGDTLRDLVDLMYGIYPSPEIVSSISFQQGVKQLKLQMFVVQPPTTSSTTSLLLQQPSSTPISLTTTSTNQLKCIANLIGHEHYVYTVAITKSGLIISGSRDNTIRVWNFLQVQSTTSTSTTTTTIKCIQEITTPNRVFKLLCCPSTNGNNNSSSSPEKVIAACWDHTIRIYDATTMNLEQTLTQHEDWVTALTLVGRNGKYLISGSADRTIRAWDTQNEFREERVLRGHTGVIYSLTCMGPDEDQFVSGGEHGEIFIWSSSVKGWKEVQRLNHHHHHDHSPPIISTTTYASVRAMCYYSFEDYPPSLLLTGATDGKIKIWNTETGFSLHGILDCNNGNVSTVGAAVGNNNNQDHAGIEAIVVIDYHRIASGSRDHLIRLWSTKDWTLLQMVDGHVHWVYALAVYQPEQQQQHRYLVSASSDTVLKVWDLE